MLNIHAFASAKGYRSYLEKESPGSWKGSGSKLLNLPEEVTKESFSSVRRGLHPETGEELRIRKVVDRIYTKPWGTEVYKAREMYDMVISAPKSVSVMALVDPRISVSHQESVSRVLERMEERNGAMVVAEYHHHNSRKLDPQEHSHLVAANLSFDGERWKTLNANKMYRAQGEITDGYREFLLRKLEQEGYKIDYPEIAGVPQELIEKFSQRSQDRDELIEDFIAYQEKEPTNKEVSILIRDNRQEKQLMPLAEARERQLERLNAGERAGLMRIKEQAQEKEVSYSLDLDDHVTHESAAPQQKGWSYGEKPKQRAY
jgi:conjugative relaxase-like TrwC/TraI family protein